MRNRFCLFALLLLVAAFFCAAPSQAGWFDWFKKKTQKEPAPAPAPVPVLSQDDMVGGLKEALSSGVHRAISNLGREGGFLDNLDVKIPMPESLARVEQTLRTLKQDRWADEFIATMNRAAEKAVPEGAAIFADAIKGMSIEDAKSILTGPDDAATQFFRKTSGAKLHEKMLPIVTQATEKAGVTSSYKQLMDHAGPVAMFLGAESTDLDVYVTDKALDGLFKMIAEEEKNIRKNPVARTTDLLKKVFGMSW